MSCSGATRVPGARGTGVGVGVRRRVGGAGRGGRSCGGLWLWGACRRAQQSSSATHQTPRRRGGARRLGAGAADSGREQRERVHARARWDGQRWWLWRCSWGVGGPASAAGVRPSFAAADGSDWVLLTACQRRRRRRRSSSSSNSTAVELHAVCTTDTGASQPSPCCPPPARPASSATRRAALTTSSTPRRSLTVHPDALSDHSATVAKV
ncbi:hypothetical protein SVAN01_06730 [Stagonosporopsis vannaccii]|nr:hypothetical protein SVAN01_06730 [Stagonosporopsis vannaccii]